MDKLELKDIAPYLPYRLKLYHLSHFKGNKIIEDWGLKNCSDYPVSEYCDGTTYGRTLQEIKPILRPMSDLTKEIIHNGETFVPIERLKEYSDHKIEFEGPDYILIKEDYSFEQNVLGAPLAVIQKLCEWHIDFQDLIGRGLAINLNEVDNGK